MIDTTFLATSEKLWPSPSEHLGRPAQFVGAIFRQEAFDRRAAFRCAQIAARGRAPLPMDGQGMACLVVIRMQRRQPLVAHQHQKALLGEIGGRRRVEAAGAVLDGVKPVGRHGLAGPRATRAEGPVARALSPDSGRGIGRSAGQPWAFFKANRPSKLTYIKPPGSSNCQKEPNISPRRAAFGDPLFDRRHHGPRE